MSSCFDIRGRRRWAKALDAEYQKTLKKKITFRFRGLLTYSLANANHYLKFLNLL